MTETAFVLEPGTLLAIDGRDRPFRLITAAVDTRGQVWAQVPAHVFHTFTAPCAVRLHGSDVVLGTYSPGEDLMLTRGAGAPAPGHFPPLDMLITAFRIDPPALRTRGVGFSPFWPATPLPVNAMLNVRAVSLSAYMAMDGRPETADTCGTISATHALASISRPDGSGEAVYNQVVEISLDDADAAYGPWEIFLSQDGGLIGPAVATDGAVKIVASLYTYLHMRDLKPWQPPAEDGRVRKRLEEMEIAFDLAPQMTFDSAEEVVA